MIARPDGRIYMCGLLGLAPYIGKLRRGVFVEAIGLFARAAPKAALQAAPWVAASLKTSDDFQQPPWIQSRKHRFGHDTTGTFSSQSALSGSPPSSVLFPGISARSFYLPGNRSWWRRTSWQSRLTRKSSSGVVSQNRCLRFQLQGGCWKASEAFNEAASHGAAWSAARGAARAKSPNSFDENFRAEFSNVWRGPNNPRWCMRPSGRAIIHF